MVGSEYECSIVKEIYKKAKKTQDARFYHLCTHEGREIYLLVETPNGYYAFEIKMAEKNQPTDARYLRNLSEIINDKPILHSYLLSNDMRTIELADGITAFMPFIF